MPRKKRTIYPSVEDLIPYGLQLPYMFEVVGRTPGVRTLTRLVEAAYADRTVVLTIFSTLAIDLQDQPLELAIAKFREEMAKVDNANVAEETLLASLEKMTLASAQVVNFDATKIINNRLKYIRTNPIGQVRVYVQAQSFNGWVLKLEVKDQRKRIFSASHDMVVFRDGTQIIGTHGSWLGN